MSALKKWFDRSGFIPAVMAAGFLIVGLLTPSFAEAKGTYFTAQQLLAEVYDEVPSSPKTLWMNKAHKQEVLDFFDKPLRIVRIKYWEKDDRRFWILSEIGKEKPITFGVVTSQGVIERMEVMAFREVRGDEIRLPAYTAQYDNQTLKPNGRLKNTVDGISGATYSVRSMKKVARLALLFDRWVTKPDAASS